MCSARYLNAPRVEALVVDKIRERILNEETIVELVTMVAEEIDAMSGELSGRLEVIEAELEVWPKSGRKGLYSWQSMMGESGHAGRAI